MSQVLRFAFAGLVIAALAGCFGGGGSKSAGDVGNKSTTSCTGSPLAEAPKLPARFPKPKGVTYTRQSTQGKTQIVD